MRLLIDQNLSRRLASLLQIDGHNGPTGIEHCLDRVLRLDVHRAVVSAVNSSSDSGSSQR